MTYRPPRDNSVVADGPTLGDVLRSPSPAEWKILHESDLCVSCGESTICWSVGVVSYPLCSMCHARALLDMENEP